MTYEMGFIMIDMITRDGDAEKGTGNWTGRRTVGFRPGRVDKHHVIVTTASNGPAMPHMQALYRESTASSHLL